jgi:thiol-disulfide isomerase/thioredoxin
MPTLSIRTTAAFLVIFSALLLPPFSAQAKEMAGKIPNGETPPAYLGLDRDNNKLYATDYAGKVLVVTFWASWCGPCLNELQVLENLQRAAKKSVQVIAINIEDRDKFKSVSRALNNLSLMLAHDYTKSVKESYGVNGIPHMVIIGRDGKVVNVHRGYGDGMIPRLVKEINAAIAAEPATPSAADTEAAKN